MDCETFERFVLDRVFLELDELTMGAAQRHVAHCSRCRTIEVGLRATRDVCRLPSVVPMDGFAEGVVAFERQIHAILPFRQRANRIVSVLAAYAMRPQPTMAALLLLMIGASLFLVRARPADRDLVQVTERGVPEADLGQLENGDTNFANSFVPLSAASTQTLGSPSEPRLMMGVVPDSRCIASGKFLGNCELDAGTAGKSVSSQLDCNVYSKTSVCDVQGAISLARAQSATGELEAARAIRRTSGCAAAIQPLEAIRQKYPASEAALDATWDAAKCYNGMNHVAEARALFESLTKSPKYAKRAKLRLVALESP